MVNELNERLIISFSRVIEKLDERTKQEMLDFIILSDGVRLLEALRKLFNINK